MQSPVGELILVAYDTSLRAVLWGDDDSEWKRAAIDRRSVIFQQSAVVEQAIAQLKEYFVGDRQEFDLPLKPIGTEFQSTVWRSLTEIKFGSTVSYSEQATSIGRASAVRAVASANGRNPISIVIPCHRVVAASGGLGGFAGGLDAKRWLLAHERELTSARS
ncbi:MAG: cysteine methyltransferase [Acidimicrobiaceae bacterium]|nr:cysteine methyltransferase [Acidimicrobiaceae bacterium]HBU76183.1 cysteine methyltransferase [Acidimicrobiaceae bacterium]|tara:strand:- start:1613 stop:2098 length:486 start_codon:yes stop_codon:yes gene_type:complete